MPGKIKIMVVDDEERILRPLAKRLEIRDFDVAAFSNGKDALEASRREEFELAILDLKMPGMSGEDLLEILKQEQPLIEAVILTGHGSIPSAVRCGHLDTIYYLQKPCETEELLDVLKNAYQRRVQRKHELQPEEMEEILNRVSGESPLGVLQRLRSIDEERDADRK
jgi:DNA-binding NtrC family response regulator